MVVNHNCRICLPYIILSFPYINKEKLVTPSGGHVFQPIKKSE